MLFLLMVRGEKIKISPLIIRGEIRNRIPRFHPACIHTDAARVLCNGRSRPSLHIGGQLQGGDWLRFRQKPLAASGGFSLVSFPGSVLFNAFSNWCYYTTMICPCQEHKSPSGGKYSENFHPRSRWSSAARPNRAARVMVSRSASPEAASSFSRRVRRNSPRRESSPARRHTSSAMRVLSRTSRA